MMLLDGKPALEAFKDDLKKRVTTLTEEGKRVPNLAAVLIGNNGASETYVASKQKNCADIGFTSTLYPLPDTVSENELFGLISKLNQDKKTDGILVQLPLPSHISEEKIFDLIEPLKDVDGFHPVNIGKMVQGYEAFISATPYGILLLLQHYKIETRSKNTVVIGRSNIVGSQ